jgi:hypothetical protein
MGGYKIFKTKASFLGKGHWKYDIVRYGEGGTVRQGSWFQVKYFAASESSLL